VDTPVEKLGQRETMMHYNAVLIEELNSKMQLVIESMQASTKQLDDKMEAIKVDLTNKMEMVRLEVISKINRFTERFDNLESRFAALEARG